MGQHFRIIAAQVLGCLEPFHGSVVFDLGDKLPWKLPWRSHRDFSGMQNLKLWTGSSCSNISHRWHRWHCHDQLGIARRSSFNLQ